MNRIRTLTPLLGLTALSAAALLAAAQPARAQAPIVTVTNLGSAGFYQSTAIGVSGSTQVGYGNNQDTNYRNRALLWHGTAASVVNLHVPGVGGTTFEETFARGVFGNTQVGYGDNFIHPRDEYFALLWHGTADSVVSLSPPGCLYSQALAVSGDTQVGLADLGSGMHAVLWHGTADSIVDLHPAGTYSSQASGVSGDTQVGLGTLLSNENAPHAILWHGTPGSVVDLNPPGYGISRAFGVAGDVQVGDALKFSGGFSAMLWRGTPDSALNLGDYLPDAYRADSLALAVSGHDGVYDVVGVGFLGSSTRPFRWHVVFAAPPQKPFLTALIPASRTEGREAFLMRVAGTGFVPLGHVVWNGTELVTNPLGVGVLEAAVPAALIAHAGVARITYRTPAGKVSNVRLVTITARPVLSSLSPVSKKAGSGMFTLTVTGANFRPASVYAPSVVKWNRTELATTYVSSTTLTAQVPASLLTKSGTATVRGTTPQVATSASTAFTITP